jgi:hypothetical protein
MTDFELEELMAEDLPAPTYYKRGLPIRIACVVAALLLLISLSPEFLAFIK